MPLTASEMQELVRAPDRDKRALALARARGIIPPGLSDEELGWRVGVFEANTKAAAGYVPGGRLSGSLVLLQRENSKVRAKDAWRRWHEGRLTAESLPGDHYAMVGQLAALLRRLLETP
jgi:hypothetical protein